jgi:hypothetical protein
LHLELYVYDAAEQLVGQIVEAHLVAGNLVHEGLHLKTTKKEMLEEQRTEAEQPPRAESRGRKGIKARRGAEAGRWRAMTGDWEK